MGPNGSVGRAIESGPRIIVKKPHILLVLNARLLYSLTHRLSELQSSQQLVHSAAKFREVKTLTSRTHRQ